MKLTLKQKKFCDEYIKTGNATEAYIKAGYNRSGARANASRLITNDNIKNYIDERLKEIEDKSIADAAEVLKYLTRIIRNEETEQVVITENIGDYTSEARIVSKELSAKDKIKAAELIGKRYRLFTDRVEADVNASVIFEGENDLED